MIRQYRAETLLALSLLIGCSNGGGGSPTEPTPLPQTLVAIEVAARSGLPQGSYPGTVPTQGLGIPQQAFGAEKGRETWWRAAACAEIQDIFHEWVNSQAYLVGWRPEFAWVDLEKTYKWTDPANWNSTRCVFEALRAELPGVQPFLYGSPRPVKDQQEASSLYSPSVVEFFQSLDDVGALAVLYIKPWPGEDWLAGVERRTRLALGVAESLTAGRTDRVHPLMWHRLAGGGDWQDAPPLYDFDPTLELTLRLQLALVDEAGIDRVSFWLATPEFQGDLETTMTIILGGGNQ